MATPKHFIYSHWLKWYYKAAKQQLNRFPAGAGAGDGPVRTRIRLLDNYPRLQLKH